jgi:hypothetical protein
MVYQFIKVPVIRSVSVDSGFYIILSGNGTRFFIKGLTIQVIYPGAFFLDIQVMLSHGFRDRYFLVGSWKGCRIRVSPFCNSSNVATSHPTAAELAE